jgi:hypothetical protein
VAAFALLPSKPNTTSHCMLKLDQVLSVLSDAHARQGFRDEVLVRAEPVSVRLLLLCK